MTALTERCLSAILRPRCTRYGPPRLAEHLAATVRARVLIDPTTWRPLII
ncbi:hypothetical protein [Streptomyces hesseae]|uniref:Uncharacterized protein n=1 Tax=Streptomyces hesseae TaxID=3075519 RepID=A0ABU2SZI3_9ACTN|nr:hypothetical protein [Streptomyces sp. DSM 40473]MDT0453784.1 hypothetical protein [Streptomyces sp. DSM 40473]